MALTVLSGVVKGAEDLTSKQSYSCEDVSSSFNFDTRWKRAVRIRSIGAARTRGLVPGARVHIAALNNLPLRTGTIVRLNTALSLDKDYPLLVVITDQAHGAASIEQVFHTECQVISPLEVKEDE